MQCKRYEYNDELWEWRTLGVAGRHCYNNKLNALTLKLNSPVCVLNLKYLG